MKKSVWIVVGIVITLIFIGIIFAINNKPNGSSNNIQTISDGKINSNTPSSIHVASISSSELANHNKSSDCWIIYKNQVYDVTSYLNMHPGGQKAITPYCGNNGFESAFLGKHGSGFETKLKSNSILKGEFK